MQEKGEIIQTLTGIGLEGL